MAHVDPRLGPLVRTRASTSRAGAHRAPQQREEAVAFVHATGPMRGHAPSRADIHVRRAGG
jgi:hypothetical protein